MRNKNNLITLLVLALAVTTYFTQEYWQPPPPSPPQTAPADAGEHSAPRTATRPARGGDDSLQSYRLPAMDTNTLAAGSEDCPAFFDADPATAAAPAPTMGLTRLDRDVLKACGPLGGHVTRSEFQELLRRNPEAIELTLPSAWRGLDVQARDRQLARAWMTHRAFQHVFCGEWKHDSVSGLHFWARYLQLQNEGTACYMPSPREETGKAGVYTIGVRSRDGSHRNPLKGYALGQDAVALLEIGNRTFAQCCDSPKGWEKARGGGYIKRFLTWSEGDHGRISNVVICRAYEKDDPKTWGLVTLYPDATPDRRLRTCKGGK